jgi:Amt family ammonium transporter
VKVNAGDTAWMLASCALVMFMTPGLAFFYGGLVRAKNVLATVMQSFIALAVVSVTWSLIGYTLAFGPDKWNLIGGLSYWGLHNTGASPIALAPTIPATVFMAFQLMFAIITPALITGAFAERMKFSGWLMMLTLWSIIVYSPVAHWVWGGGFLGAGHLGAEDFAGGTVVHINAGVAALVSAIYLGKRKGWGKEAFVPHNVPFVVLGAAILWFGWFGFNAGSALTSGALAGSAFVATHPATATAVLGWLIPEWIRTGKATTVGAASGAVAGLVAITPASGFVGTAGALCIGFVAGVVCYFAVNMKFRFGFDDSLDVVGVHMVGGIIGALLTGVFTTAAINGVNGSLAQVGKQAVAVLVTLLYSGIMTWIILKVTDKTVGLRVNEEDEFGGLDLSEHQEVGYTFSSRGGSLAAVAAGGHREEAEEGRVPSEPIDLERASERERADVGGGPE